MWTQVCTYWLTQVCTHVYTQVYVQVCTHMCTHVYICVYTHVCTHVCTWFQSFTTRGENLMCVNLHKPFHCYKTPQTYRAGLPRGWAPVSSVSLVGRRHSRPQWGSSSPPCVVPSLPLCVDREHQLKFNTSIINSACPSPTVRLPTHLLHKKHSTQVL